MWDANRVRTLTHEEASDLYRRLLFYSYKRYSWIEHRLSTKSLEDIVQETFVDVLNGNRRIDPDQPLFQGMCSIVWSKVSHAWAAGKRISSVDANENADLGNSLCELLLDRFSRENPQLMQPVSPSDDSAIYNELCHRILELVAGDELLTAIVKLWFEIPDLKPQDIALKLGLEMPKLRQAQKRLKSRVKALREVRTNA